MTFNSSITKEPLLLKLDKWHLNPFLPITHAHVRSSLKVICTAKLTCFPEPMRWCIVYVFQACIYRSNKSSNISTSSLIVITWYVQMNTVKNSNKERIKFSFIDDFFKLEKIEMRWFEETMSICTIRSLSGQHLKIFVTTA